MDDSFPNHPFKYMFSTFRIYSSSADALFPFTGAW